MTQAVEQSHASRRQGLRKLLLTVALSLLMSVLGVIWLVGLCFVLAWLGAGMLGFWILSAPGSALSPVFSFITSLLPRSLFHALVGTSSVGSSFGLLALWSTVFWFVLFWIIAFVVLRIWASRHNRMPPASRENTAQQSR